MCDGLKRARSQFVTERTTQNSSTTGADGTAAASGAAPTATLLETYLASSPEAEELFRIWEGLKPVRSRDATRDFLHYRV